MTPEDSLQLCLLNFFIYKTWIKYTLIPWFLRLRIKKTIAFQLSQTYNPIDFLKIYVVKSFWKVTLTSSDSWCESLITTANSSQKLTKCCNGKLRHFFYFFVISLLNITLWTQKVKSLDFLKLSEILKNWSYSRSWKLEPLILLNDTLRVLFKKILHFFLKKFIIQVQMSVKRCAISHRRKS